MGKQHQHDETGGGDNIIWQICCEWCPGPTAPERHDRDRNGVLCAIGIQNNQRTANRRDFIDRPGFGRVVLDRSDAVINIVEVVVEFGNGER